MLDNRTFLRGLPKAELHLHIEGSLEPELMMALAQRNRVDLPFSTVDDIRKAYRFSNLQDFLDIYYQGADVLREAEDFHDLARAYFERAHQDGVVHAEIFFDPQTHTDRGIGFDAVMEGLSKAQAAAKSEFGLSSHLILCFLRHLDEEAAFDTLKAASPWQDKIIGVGLDSSELGHPPSKFARVFARAGEMGFKRVAHAGEEGPPDYVFEALDLLHIDRLDHGNRSLEDEGLTARLVRDKMTLTVCPLSNLKLCVVNDLRKHPIKTMLDKGLKATLNADDPAYFGGYVVDNFMAVMDAGLIDRSDAVQLARNSIVGSFLEDADRDRHLAAIETYISNIMEIN